MKTCAQETQEEQPTISQENKDKSAGEHLHSRLILQDFVFTVREIMRYSVKEKVKYDITGSAPNFRIIPVLKGIIGPYGWIDRLSHLLSFSTFVRNTNRKLEQKKKSRYRQPLGNASKIPGGANIPVIITHSNIRTHQKKNGKPQGQRFGLTR